MIVSHLQSFSGAYITGVTLDLLPKCSMMEGLCGCRVKVDTTKNQGLT